MGACCFKDSAHDSQKSHSVPPLRRIRSIPFRPTPAVLEPRVFHAALAALQRVLGLTVAEVGHDTLLAVFAALGDDMCRVRWEIVRDAYGVGVVAPQPRPGVVKLECAGVDVKCRETVSIVLLKMTVVWTVRNVRNVRGSHDILSKPSKPLSESKHHVSYEMYELMGKLGHAADGTPEVVVPGHPSLSLRDVLWEVDHAVHACLLGWGMDGMQR